MTCTYEFATPAYDCAVDLRHRVLRLPLGRDIADDPLAEEYDDTHVGAFHGGTLVGTACLRTDAEGDLKMRQVAVEPSCAGRGVGRALVMACEEIARRRGARRLYCHARDAAQGFYAACGWVVEGEGFVEVGIPHHRMSAPTARLRAPGEAEAGLHGG